MSNYDTLKRMMDRGVLIFEANSDFILKKVPTGMDGRSHITNETKIDTSFLKFDTYDDAMERALFEIRDEAMSVPWEVYIQYNDGLGPKSKRMDDIFSKTLSEAQRAADEIGKDKYDDQFMQAIVRCAMP